MTDQPQDPQAVERFFADRNNYQTEECVLASDYDELLRMWEEERSRARVAEHRDSLNLKVFTSYIRDRNHRAVMSDLEVSEVIREWTRMEEEGIGPQDIAESTPQKGGE